MTSKEAAEKWNLSKRQVNSLCLQGKIIGAKLENGRWIIPDDYEYQRGAQAPSISAIPKPQKYFNIGNEGFKTIRNGDYVDKSGLISFMNSCLSTSKKLICVSRPRRFGKTLNMDMLRVFFEISEEDTSKYFSDK